MNPAIVKQLAALAECFGTALTSARLALYTTHLADIEPAVLEAAIEKAALVCEYFPAIARLRELAGMGGEDAGEAEALAAWAAIDTHVRRHGIEGRIYRGPAKPDCTTCEGTGRVRVKGLLDVNAPCDCRERVAAPVIPDRVMIAVQLIGGLERIESARGEYGKPTRDFGFIRKEFLAAYGCAPAAARAYRALASGSVPLLPDGKR